MPSEEKEISHLTLRIINCQYERQHRSVLWLAMVRRPKPYLITNGVFIPSECFFQYAPEYSAIPPVRCTVVHVTLLPRCTSLDGLAVGCVVVLCKLCVLLFGGLSRCIGFCDWNLPSTSESRGREQVSNNGITVNSAINHTCIPDVHKTVPNSVRVVSHTHARYTAHAAHSHATPHYLPTTHRRGCVVLTLSVLVWCDELSCRRWCSV